MQVSVEENVLSDLTAPGGFDVITDPVPMDGGGWDLSLPSVPSWNQLVEWGDLMAAPPMTRTD